MSDTPRTDGEMWRELESGIDVVEVDFARQLERELNAALRIIAQLEADLEQRDKDYENLQNLM